MRPFATSTVQAESDLEVFSPPESMAFDPSHGLGGFVASSSSNIPDFGADLPIFNLERVALEFQIASDFVAVKVANNVIILALASNRLLRIDLHNPQDVDGTPTHRPGSLGCL